MNIIINDALSRSYFGSQPYDPDIIMILDELELSIDDFRTSKQLHKLFDDIITILLNEKKILASTGSHYITIRFKAMTSLLVHQLCIPHLFDILGIGIDLKGLVSGFWGGAKQNTQSVSSSNIVAEEETASTRAKGRVIVRAKGIILEAFTLMKIFEESLVNPDYDVTNIDERMSYLLINLLDFQTSPVLPHVMTVRQYGYPALEAITCYMLSVTAVSQVIKESIQRVVNSMTDILGDDRKQDLTFQGNNQALKAILMGYFQYLRENAVVLIKDSRKDEIIMSVNTNLRHALKHENYQSPYEIIQVYQRKYKGQLTHLPIPLQSYSMEDIQQAKKDIIRDRVMVNKVLYCSGLYGAASNVPIIHLPRHAASISSMKQTAWDAIKGEIKKVLIFSLGVDRPELFEESASMTTSSAMTVTAGEYFAQDSNNKSTKSDVLGIGQLRHNLSFEKFHNQQTSALTASSCKCESSDETIQSHESGITTREKDSPSSSLGHSENALLQEVGNESSKPPTVPSLTRTSSSGPQRVATTGSSDGGFGLMRRSSINNTSFTSADDETEAFLRKKSNNSSLTTTFSSPNASLVPIDSSDGCVAAPSSSSKNSQSMFYYLPQQLQSNEYFYADILSILHAYTVLAASRTFAGGDAFIILNDLYGGDGLTICPYKVEHGRSSQPSSPVRMKDQSPRTNTKNVSSGNNKEDGDVQIAITTSGIKVVVKERYQLFSAYDLETCCDLSTLQPLMCFECTTTTLLILSSERIAQIPLDLQNISSSAGFQQHEKAYRLFQLLVTNPQQICHRAVSIEPLLPTSSW